MVLTINTIMTILTGMARKTIQTYIALTREEYHRLAVIAAEEKTSIAQLLAEKAREIIDVYYPAEPPQNKSSVPY